MTKNIKQILSSSCFSIEAFADMNELCKDKLTKFGFTAFEYARVYKDCTAFILYSNPYIADYVINNEVPISALVPEEIIDTEFWFIPDSSGPHVKDMRALKEISNSESFANYIRRHHDYYEMACFLMSQRQSIAVNKFINMKEILEQSVFNFVDKAKYLIDHANKERFALTESMRPNIGWLDHGKQAYKAKLNLHLRKAQEELVDLNMLYLSPRLNLQELKCTSLLLEGKTCSDIAEHLHLSKRTVEMHVNSIKLKLDCAKKSDIIPTLLRISDNLAKLD